MIGPVGAVLAVPASLFVKAIFVDVDPERRWLTPLLSNAPDIDAPDTEEPAVDGVETTGSASPRPSVGAGLSVEGGQGTLEDDHEDPESAGKERHADMRKAPQPGGCSGPPAVNHEQRHDEDQGDVGRCHGLRAE